MRGKLNATSYRKLRIMSVPLVFRAPARKLGDLRRRLSPNLELRSFWERTCGSYGSSGNRSLMKPTGKPGTLRRE